MPQMQMVESSEKTPRSFLNVFILSLGHLFNDFYCNFIPILLPILIPKLGLSLVLSGILVMILSLTANVLQPFVGFYMDKYNFNRLMPYLIPLGGLFICFTTWATNFTTLVILVALSGLAVSTFHPMGAGLVNKLAPEGKLSISMSMFVAGGNLGFTFAPLILVYFIGMYDLMYLPVLVIPGLLLGLWMYISKVDRQRFVDKATAAQMHFDLKGLLKNHNIVLLNIAMGLRAWAFTAIVTFLPLWATTSFGYSDKIAGWLLSIYLAGTVIGGIVGGFLNDIIGFKKVIMISMFLGVFPTLYVLMHGELTILFYIMLFLGGACAMAANPGSIVWGQALLPDNPGMASGMMLGLSFGIGGIGTMLTSSLGQFTNLTLALEITTLLLFLATVLSYFIPEHEKSHS